MSYARTLLLAAASLYAATLPARALQLKETYKDWAVYVHEDKSQRNCFAISKPLEMEPKTANRGTVFVYVSSWPADKVKNEVSVKIGYPMANDAAPAVIVGSDQFNLFADGDKAFVADETMESSLIDAMRKGSSLIVKGRSARGTETIDKYSLNGIKAALDRVSQECK